MPAPQPEAPSEKLENINLEDAHAIKHKLDATVVDVSQQRQHVAVIWS